MKSIEAIFWGALAFIVALIAEIISSSFGDGPSLSGQADPDFRTVMLLVLIEELAKFLVLMRAAAGKIIAPAPIMIFGAVFGSIEVWLLGQRNELGIMNGLVAAMPIILVHLGTAVIYGYCLNRKNWAWLAGGLAVGIIFHAAYNFQEIIQISAPSIRWMQVSALTLAAIALIFAQTPSLHDKDA
jgi:hypothetical protein